MYVCVYVCMFYKMIDVQYACILATLVKYMLEEWKVTVVVYIEGRDDGYTCSLYAFIYMYVG